MMRSTSKRSLSVTVSSRFQIVIPKDVRKALKIKPGMRFHVVAYDKRIELIPEVDIRKMRGALRGMNTDFVRDEDRF